MDRCLTGLMVTMTTYGTWLRGDERGWIEDGRLRKSAPRLAAHDAGLMKHASFRFDPAQFELVGDAIGRSLIDRAAQRVLALAVRTTHVHLVVLDSQGMVPDIVKCAKDAVRYALRPGRPIWTTGHDKRFCQTQRSLQTRIAYVERHNVELGLPARPWTFIEMLDG